jgi:heme/copper-type cytochrome/quinol oxidase subunit 3
MSDAARTVKARGSAGAWIASVAAATGVLELVRWALRRKAEAPGETPTPRSATVAAQANANVVGDLSRLPAAGFRTHGLWFWAAMAFMLMEGVGFTLGIGAYLYLMNGAAQWPLTDRPPDLTWGTAQTVLLLASVPPTLIMSRAARLRQIQPTRFWAVVVFAMNTLCLVIRGFEFGHLNTHVDTDAYGSVTWALMLLHTTHLVTDFVDTFFVTVFLFTHSVDTERFSDVDDDAVYWLFVVACWLPIYALVYLAPRWLA